MAEVRSLRSRPLRTVTPGQGKGFANHECVSRQPGGARFYSRAPRHPWGKGANENTNGLIREFLPKGADLSRAGEDEVRPAFSMIGDRPRRVLGFRAAREVHPRRCCT